MNAMPATKSGNAANSTELYLKGTRQLKAGQYEEAKRSFRENEEKSGTSGQTAMLLQQAERALNDGALKDAAAQYASVMMRNPGIADAYVGLARVALFNNQLKAARLHATAATRLAPQHGLAWTLLGLVHEAESDTPGALPLVAKGAVLAPSTALCQLNLGRVLVALDRPAEALAPLNAAAELEPHNADMLALLGHAYRLAGQPLLALRWLERARDLEPKRVARWTTLAEALLQAGQFRAATEMMEVGVQQLGEQAALYEIMVAAALMQGDVAGAIATLERQVQGAPEHQQGWENLLNLRLVKGAHAGALEAGQVLTERFPEQWKGWFLLGTVHDAMANTAEAVAAYRKAISLKSDDFRPLTNLATLCLESASTAQTAEAMELLQRALPLAPKGEWRVHYNLALAHAQLGQKAPALEFLRKIQKEADPALPVVADAQRLEATLLDAKAEGSKEA